MTTYKGFYSPMNPAKYIGDITKIRFLSNWERMFMVNLDRNNNVIGWNSEDVIIPYICGTDGKPHRYLVDFYVVYRSSVSQVVNKHLIEIKPYKETIPPIAPKRLTKKSELNYQKANMTWVKNQSKWKYAREYCSKYNMSFSIYSEYELGIKKRK